MFAILNFSAFFLFLLSPYYFLGEGQYFPKSNPNFGYSLPQTLEAWFFFVTALAFFALFWVTFVIWIRRARTEHPRWKSG
jgi:hypothetical protein